MRFRAHADKLAYFFIAFAVCLLARAGAMCPTLPLTRLLYASIGISLLAGNIPRVLDIPLHFAHPMRRVEYCTFALSVACFAALCLYHLL